MEAIQNGGIQFQYDIAAAWRGAYMQRVNQNREQQRPRTPPSRSISPDSFYGSQSEGRTSPSSSSSSSSSASSSVSLSSMSSLSSMFTLPGREDHLGFIYDYDVKSQGVRVDRRSLLKLVGLIGTRGTGYLFFRVMTMTNTLIHWPQDIKEEDVVKDDPFIRIVGTPDKISCAKRLILGNFLLPGSLIKLRMAIPKCDRSRIMGAAQNRIMFATRTRVHFEVPGEQEDAAAVQKVAIHGSVVCLEQAREALRLAVPFIISFEMHVARGVHTLHQMPFIKKMESRLNVKITFFATNLDSVYQVLVEGTEDEARKVKEAVGKLSSSSLGRVMKPVFRLIMSVCNDVVGVYTADDSAILKTAMANTDTEINVVESSEGDGSTKLIISGSVPDIHNAKRELVGFIPVELVFEVDDDKQDTDAIRRVADKHDLQVTIQQRDDLNVLCISLVGSERYVQNIYDAHQEILYLQAKADNMWRVPCLELPQLWPLDGMLRAGADCGRRREFSLASVDYRWKPLELARKMPTPSPEEEVYLNIQLPPSFDLCIEDEMIE